MTIQDDRNEAQKRSHTWLVVARDRFMSGWGQARGGYSRCAWAFETLADAERAESRIAARGDMQYVRVTRDTYRPPRGTVHFHIYVVDSRDHFTLR